MLAKASSLPSTPIPIIPDTRKRMKLCNRGIWSSRQLKYNSWSVMRNRRLLIPQGTWCSKIWSWELKRARREGMCRVLHSKTLRFLWALHPCSTCSRSKSALSNGNMSWGVRTRPFMSLINSKSHSSLPILTKKINNKESNKEIASLTWWLIR